MELYVVISAISGEEGYYDYRPHPYVLGVYENYQDAKSLFDQEVQAIIDDCEEGDLEIEVDDEETTIVNTVDDWCNVFKIISTKLN